MDHYLAWAPAEMATGAHWLARKSDLVEESANAIRESGERGTEGQCGQFITQRREEATELARRVHELGDMLSKADGVVRRAGAELDTLVTNLREVETEMRDRGFVRVAGDLVSDTRTTYADAEDRSARESEAENVRTRIRDLRDDIRAVDERANQELHALVGREVRDRTAAGNGDPFVVGLSGTAQVSASAAGGAALFEGRWYQAVLDSGRGLVMAKSLGPVVAGLGFLGGVAARPKGEPLGEAVVAEGVGTLAGAAGGPVGFLFGAAFAGPPGGLVLGAVGTLGGGPLIGSLAASEVREAFDRAN